MNEYRAAVKSLPVGEVVWLTNRKAVSWGDFSLSAAYLAGFDTILQTDQTGFHYYAQWSEKYTITFA